MTYVYSRQTTITAGSLEGITKFLTVLGSGVQGVVKGFTQGKVDEDTLLIKASTTENDLLAIGKYEYTRVINAKNYLRYSKVKITVEI